MAILQGTTITILGLNGSTTAAEHGQATELLLASQLPGDVLQPKLKWENSGCSAGAGSCGRAVVEVQAAPWPADRQLVFGWHLQNAETTRGPNPDVQVSAQIGERVVRELCKVANATGRGCIEENDVLVVDRYPGELCFTGCA